MTEAAKNQTNFKIKSGRGLTTLEKDGAKFEVTPDRNVTLSDADKGVQVISARKPAASAKEPSPDLDISDDCQTIGVYGTSVTAPEDSPALVITSGIVTLVREETPETAAAVSTETKPGIELKIGKDGATGMIDGTAFDIDPSSHEVAVDTDRIQITPAAKASADKRATKISLSADFNKAALRNAGVRVNIRLDENGVPGVETNGKIRVVSASNADTKGAEIKVDGDMTRLDLNGHVFDINTVNGQVIVYGRDFEPGYNKPAAAVSADMKAYQIAIGQDGKRVALNNASVGKSADGVLAVATDGTGLFKATASVIALAAAAEKAAADRKAADKGWVLAGNSPEEDMLLYIKPVGLTTFEEAEKAAEALRTAGVTDAHILNKSEAKVLISKKDNKDLATIQRISAVFKKASEGTPTRIWTSFRWHGIGGQRTVLGLSEVEPVFSNGWEKREFATVLARNVPRNTPL